ncbi:PREDICTED: starch synthase 3, chloroplastic/amyloplastic-like isoform X1 [Lupinus angustifolius]|uniref:starch synthase 3, chloroplastic/amyloplastic-like isoform X1 n=1 Tax=Lupinus angustifolius TaxID=3871 RepID=UPI00092EE078|nr:PREDICTED: starch synthase 3, chloroplastic/amyloplastic-like isoform X1 [Lupinus angustifolius]
MDFSLKFNSKSLFSHTTPCFNLNPFLLTSFPHHQLTLALSHSSSQCKAGWGACCINASADFSRRRQQKKGSSSRPKGPASKGFVSKSSIGTSNQQKDKKNARVKGDPLTPLASEISGDDNKQTLEVNIDADEGGGGGAVEPSHLENFEVVDKTDEVAGELGELSLSDETLAVVAKTNQGGEIENISVIDEDVVVLQQEQIPYIEDFGNVKKSDGRTLGYVEISEHVQETKTDSDDEIAEESITETSTGTDDKINEEASRLLELEAISRKQEIERIAYENLSQETKLFVYPPVVKPDQDIEIFLNKSLSTLANESDILIIGAFNDWRWKSFTFRLNNANLKGDWWSCQLHVPREAYKVDFVFFNGQDVYDNNDQKDFYIPVEGGMDELAFADFLLEEKRKELVKLAKEQAEKERQAEEQRRMEEDKAAREADRSQARVEIERRREVLPQLLKNAVNSLDNVWYIEPSEFKDNDLVRLYYNRSSGLLAHAKEIWIHGGHNNWIDGLSIIERLVKSVVKDGNWWYADVIVPHKAIVLDWVFADGPPESAAVYDNNLNQDFHAVVTMVISEQYWAEEEQLIYRKLQEERKLREKTMRVKAEKTAQMKAETKERTLKSFLLSQKHIVFTEPLDVQAGSIATVFYNPSNTNLNGKPEVWFRGSFNRWSHSNGPLPPQRMLPADNGTHVKASVKVPLDAYMMDFVFSELEDGGEFDNKFGMDYHIPVFGGIVKEPPLHIIHISVEMAPIAKVGGLGDVVTSLSRAVQDLNHNVDIILPKYDCLNLGNVKDFHYHNNYFWGGTEIKVWRGKVEGLSVYFLEPQNGFFHVGCVYGRANDAERFGFFCHAALEFLLQNGFHPDIIHCHDWSSAPVAWLFKENYVHYGLSKAQVVFTIHNLEFGANFIAKAMQHSDKATTVSPTYSREVAGHPAVAPHLPKFHGIINGIDPDIWDPYNDNFIPVSYTSENVVEGKRASKEALQLRLGLEKADLPLVGIITRLTHQKGIHLIKHAIWRTLERGGQIVLLGSAPDPRIQNDFVSLANQLHSTHNARARLCLSYDEPLSHLIYAGADFIVVPSIFEPCGLTQLTAMRYGAIPVVRKTGGLYDTVFDVDHDKDRAQAQGLEPNGFGFDGADAGGVDYALNRAISAWYEGRDWFDSLCKKVMEQDWSWNRPALDYLELYHAARKSL